jgi:hypothetical protein
MNKSIILGVAAALLTAASAHAQQPVRRGADANADGRISLAEMQVKAAERFARIDVNRDGRLTREERQAARTQIRAEREQRRAERQGQRAERRAEHAQRQGDRAQRGREMFARLDANRDGFLAQSEAPPRLAQRFAQLDADRDARLSPAELQAGRQAMRAERGPRGERGQGRRHAGQAARVRADANGDGVLTRAELDASVHARFVALDANRDGFVTRDERRDGRGGRRG